MSTDNENTEDTSHLEKTLPGSISNLRNSSTDPKFLSIDDKVNQVYDISQQNKVICLHESCCFDDDLKGEDLKTMEYPVENTSYSLTSPRWLNDKLVHQINQTYLKDTLASHNTVAETHCRSKL